jgi:hypothetical protein
VANVLQFQGNADPRVGVGPQPRAEAAPVFDVGRPLAQVAGSVGELAQVELTHEQRTAILNAATQAQDYRLQQIKESQARQDAAPADTRGYGASFLDWQKEQTEARLKAAPDDMTRQYLQRDLKRVNDTFAERALTFESTRNVQFGKDQVAASADTGKRAVFTDPSQLDAVLADHITAIHAAPGLSEAAKQELTLKDRHELTATAWIGSGEKDARGTLARLKQGLPDGMTPEAGMQLEGHLSAVVHQQDAEARQEQRIRAAEAKAAAAQQRAENAANLQQRWQGALDMAGNGATNAHPITLAEVRAAVPPHEVEKTWNRYQDQLRGARAAGEMRLLSVPEQDAKLADLAKARDATQDPAEYGDRAGAYQAAAKAASAERTAFRADPAQYVAGNVPAVRQAFDAARQDPSQYPAAVALSLEHQKRIDPTADPVPLPKEAASNAVETWKAAPDAAGKLAALAPLTLALARKGADGTTVDDTLARKSLDQLEAAGLPAGVDRALEAARSGDENRAREIMATLSVKEGDLPKLADQQKGAVGQAITRLYQQPNLASAEAHAAIVTGQPGNVQMAARGQNLVRQLTERYATTEDADAAAQRAYRTVYGDGETAGSADLGVVPVPRGVDAGQLQTGLAVARQNVDVSHLAPTKEAVKAMLPPGASEGEVNGALAQATGDHNLWADDVRQYSRWAPAPGGYQLVLPSGQAVTGADGKPRVWSTDDIVHHAVGGTATAPPLVPTAEGEPAMQGVDVPAPISGSVDKGAYQQPAPVQGGARGGDGVPNPFADPEAGGGGFTLAPVNVRTFVRALASPGAVPRRDDFSDSDVAAVHAAVAEQVAQGKTSGVIGYGDYAPKDDKGRKGFRFGGDEGFSSALYKSLTDPAFRMETTLGMAKWRIDDDNHLIVSDHYNFDANDKKKAEELAKHGGATGSLLAALRDAGPMGFLNALGNLRVGTENDKKRRAYEIDFGPLKGGSPSRATALIDLVTNRPDEQGLGGNR